MYCILHHIVMTSYLRTILIAVFLLKTCDAFTVKTIESTMGSLSNVYMLTEIDRELTTPNHLSMKNTENKIRVKRQGSGAGKFTESAKMPQIKALRIFLQMFKNYFASFHVGGRHPFHPAVPKPAVWLFRDRIIEFFFPDVGQEREKKSH